MLQAQTEKGELVTPAILTRQEQRRLKEKETFHCPECKDKVIFRLGNKVIPHFAHEAKSDCGQTGGEGPYHMKAKLQLYRWLKKRYPETFLEKFIPKINQRPDILVNINGKYIAVEFQSSVISPHIVRSRNHGYLSMNIIPVWFISAKLFKRIGNCKIKIDRFTMEFLQNYPSDSIDRVYYYCPYRQLFLKVSSLHMTSNSHAFANMQYFPIKHITFPQLLRNETTEQKMYVPYWLKEKQNFRMKHSTYYGAELKWRKWLYNKGLYIHQLPAIVHLPIKAGYTFKVPPWQWQSYLVIGFLCPLALNQSFTLQKAKRFLHHLIKDAGAFLLLQNPSDPISEYLNLLTKLKYLLLQDENTYVKIREIIFPDHIETAMRTDKQLMLELSQADFLTKDSN